MNESILVHQIWMNPEETEEITQPNKETQEMMDEWKEDPEVDDYILWNHITMREYIEETDPTFLGVYDNLPIWIERCDSFRYFVLHHMGGVYIDADAKKAGSLKELFSRDELSNSQAILLSEEGGEHLGNHFIAATKGSQFMKLLYKGVKTGNPLVFFATGPEYVKAQLKIYQGEGVTLIPEEDLPIAHQSARSWCNQQYWMMGTYYLPILLIILVGLVILYFLYKWGSV